MSTERLLPLLLMAFLVSPTLDAAGQITIDASGIEGFLGQPYEGMNFTNEAPEASAALQALIDTEGAEVTYDFSDISFTDTLTGLMQYFEMPADVPYADDPHFSMSGLVLQYTFGTGDADTTAWTYSELREDGFYSYGFVVPLGEDADDDGVEDTLVWKLDPPELTQPLPFTYGDTWTTAWTGVDTEVTVDAWGTLIAPNGQVHDVLRLRNVSSVVPGFEMVSYSFVTDGLVSASLSVGMDGTVQSVSFTQVSPASGTSVASAEVPEDFGLQQNYPNPFNPVTTIAFELPQAQDVRLTVHDALGREVAVLVDGRQAPGRHRVSFNAAHLRSGLYFYRLQAGVHTHARAMTLLK